MFVYHVSLYLFLGNIDLILLTTIFVMLLSKKWKVKRFLELEKVRRCDIIHYSVTPLSGLAVNILPMLST